MAYHGTPHLEAVLAEGLAAARASCGCRPGCVWLALLPEDEPGAWPADDDGSPSWQAHHAGDVPPSALRRLDAVDSSP